MIALTEYGKGFEVQNRNTDMSIQYDYLNTVRRLKVKMRALSQNLIISDTSEAIGQLFPEVKMRLSRTYLFMDL